MRSSGIPLPRPVDQLLRVFQSLLRRVRQRAARQGQADQPGARLRRKLKKLSPLVDRGRV